MKLRMEGFKTFVFIISLFVFDIQMSYGSSVSCTTIYGQRGVSAVLESPECSYSLLSNQTQAMNCQFSKIKGSKGQEDGISCNLDMQIPFTGTNGTEDVKVGVVGIFDGMFNNEASDMASKLLLDYFLAHTVYLSSKVTSLPIDEESTHRRILKDALLRTLHDIESTFLKEAVELGSGTTATVALLVDGQILVANIGDSKAFLCSESINSHNVTEGTIVAKEMTQDHYITREDERARFEAAGGRVMWWNNKPEAFVRMTRSIGQVPSKRYGVIAEPEVTDWQPLTAEDTYLVLQTRAVTSKLKTPQNVCQLLPTRHSTSAPVPCPVEASLAECITSYAVHKKMMPPLQCPHWASPSMCDFMSASYQGTGRDYSAIVVPLISSGFLQQHSSA